MLNFLSSLFIDKKWAFQLSIFKGFRIFDRDKYNSKKPHVSTFFLANLMYYIIR